jgi:lipooligosaccharide transport system permease protein
VSAASAGEPAGGVSAPGPAAGAAAVPRRTMRRLEPAAIAGVMSREVANFRTYWRGTTFSSVLEPLVYLLAFGLGLGATLVDEVEGVPYIQFVGTGMVATAVIFSSALPAMFGTFVKHRFQHTYEAILAAPVDVEELVSAEMLWIATRSAIYGCVPLVVTFFWGLEPAPGMLLVPLFAFVTALGFAGFGVAMAATVAKIDQFNYVTALFVTPLFLVAGTFFPISGLPQGFQDLAQVNPLHQLVELVRGGAFGFEPTDLARFAFLVAFAFLTWRVAVRRMHVRLID